MVIDVAPVPDRRVVEDRCSFADIRRGHAPITLRFDMRALRVAIAVLVAGTTAAGMPIAAPVTIAVAGRAMEPGELLVLSIGAPDAATALHLTVFERVITAYKVGSGRWNALLGIDLDQP